MAKESNIENDSNTNCNQETNDDDHLTANQTEILLQFQDLTSLEDLDYCRNLLVAKNWNIEEAVRNYYFEVQDINQNENEINENINAVSSSSPSSPFRPLSTTETVNNHNQFINTAYSDTPPSTSSSTSPVTKNIPPTSSGIPSPPSPRSSSSNNNSNNNNNNSSIVNTNRQQQQQQITLLNFIPRLLSFSFHTIYDSFLRILRFAWSIIRPDPRRFVVDPVEDVTNFVRTYNETYGNEHPTFYLGTYSQALNDAKRELKFLIVYLHCEEHQDTNEFCLNVLSHKEVINYINRNNLLFWACSVNLPEGFRVSQALRENTYPFLALVVLKDTRMTVVRRFEGKTTVERFLSRLQQGIENNQASLIAARLDRQERNMTHILRKEQDKAYMESLKIDQEKERKRQEEKKRKDEQIELEKQRKLNELNKKERIKQLRQILKENIPNEPSSSMSNENDNEIIKLSIKLPNGQRLERKFLKSESIKYLYYFIFSMDENLINFQIMTNFPRRVLPGKSPKIPESDEELEKFKLNLTDQLVNNDDKKVNNQVLNDVDDDSKQYPTFCEIGLGRSEMLFVHDLEA